MKHFNGRADALVRAPVATCFSVLATVERYPSWCGEFIREVTVLERDPDGRAVRARVVVYVAQSPFGKRFEFDAAIRSQPVRAVHLSRMESGPSDSDRFSLSWSLEDAQRTRIALKQDQGTRIGLEDHEETRIGLEDRQGTRIGLEFAAAVSFLPGLLPLPGVGDLIARTLVDAATHQLDGAIGPVPGARSSV